MITAATPANVASGGVVIVGALKGVAAGAALLGQPVDVATVGVFRLPKVSANRFAVGAVVYWDAAAGLATSESSGNTLLGYAVEVAGSGVATIAVRLG